MTAEQFDAAHQAFRRRQPFRAFLIEFTSGAQMLVGHPEAVRQESQLYVTRSPDGGYVLFAADNIARLFDVPTTAAT